MNQDLDAQRLIGKLREAAAEHKRFGVSITEEQFQQYQQWYVELLELRERCAKLDGLVDTEPERLALKALVREAVEAIMTLSEDLRAEEPFATTLARAREALKD